MPNVLISLLILFARRCANNWYFSGGGGKVCRIDPPAISHCCSSRCFAKSDSKIVERRSGARIVDKVGKQDVRAARFEGDWWGFRGYQRQCTQLNCCLGEGFCFGRGWGQRDPHAPFLPTSHLTTVYVFVARCFFRPNDRLVTKTSPINFPYLFKSTTLRVIRFTFAANERRNRGEMVVVCDKDNVRKSVCTIDSRV